MSTKESDVTSRWEVELRGPDGHVFPFDPGALCLRFVVTGGEGERTVFETLHEPDDLTAWIHDAMDLTATDPTSADLGAAKRLREAIWACASARARGAPLPTIWTEVVNDAASAPPPEPVIDRTGRRVWRQPVATGQVLSVVARDAIDVLAGPSAQRVRRCQGRDCSLVFVDRSRPGQRRWCSMERCGNREKVRAYRERHQEEETT